MAAMLCDRNKHSAKYKLMRNLDNQVGHDNIHRLSGIIQRLQKNEIAKYLFIYRFFSQICNELYFRLIFHTYLNQKFIVNFFIFK